MAPFFLIHSPLLLSSPLLFLPSFASSIYFLHASFSSPLQLWRLFLCSIEVECPLTRWGALKQGGGPRSRLVLSPVYPWLLSYPSPSPPLIPPPAQSSGKSGGCALFRAHELDSGHISTCHGLTCTDRMQHMPPRVLGCAGEGLAESPLFLVTSPHFVKSEER